MLKSVNVRAVQNLMDDKISGRAMINARGVNPHPIDFSLRDQKLGGLFGESWEVESFRIAGCHTAQILHLVRPVPPPSGMHKDNGAYRDPSVPSFPGLQIVHREPVVSIVGDDFPHIDDHRRTDYAIQANLIQSVLT